MKKTGIKIFILSLVITGLASCLKKGDATVDIKDLTGTIIELQYLKGGSTVNSGLQYFTGGALNFPATDESDTVDINVSIAGPTTLSSDLTVTIGVDPSKVLDNLGSDSLYYELMPDSLFSIPQTTAVVKAGSRVAPLKVVFFPSKVDPSKSYNLPVKITDAQGRTISSNLSTIYFHFIGNPLAGNYSLEGYFYHPASPRALSDERVLSAVNSKTLVTDLGDLGGSGYYAELTVDDPYNTTDIQNVTISVYPGSIDPIYVWPAALPNDNPGYTPGWAKSALCNNTYDPATKTFYLRYGYLGGTGYRVTEEIMTMH